MKANKAIKEKTKRAKGNVIKEKEGKGKAEKGFLFLRKLQSN